MPCVSRWTPTSFRSGLCHTHTEFGSPSNHRPMGGVWVHQFYFIVFHDVCITDVCVRQFQNNKKPGRLDRRHNSRGHRGWWHIQGQSSTNRVFEPRTNLSRHTRPAATNPLVETKKSSILHVQDVWGHTCPVCEGVFVFSVVLTYHVNTQTMNNTRVCHGSGWWFGLLLDHMLLFVMSYPSSVSVESYITLSPHMTPVIWGLFFLPHYLHGISIHACLPCLFIDSMTHRLGKWPMSLLVWPSQMTVSLTRSVMTKRTNKDRGQHTANDSSSTSKLDHTSVSTSWIVSLDMYPLDHPILRIHIGIFWDR